MNTQISISKFSQKHAVSTSKVIRHLVDTNKLISKNSELISNTHFLTITKPLNQKILKVNEEKLITYLKNDWDKLTLHDTEKYTIGNIKDTNILQNKLKGIMNKKLMFLDFEFKRGNYYEASYHIYENMESVSNKYFFTKDIDSSDKHINLAKKNIKFSILDRESINKELNEAIKDIDYIVGHNSYSERSMLIKNNIFLNKHKFICTSNICKKINSFKNEPSLSKCLNHYKIKYQNELQHFAFYDVLITKKLFDKIVSTLP